MTEEAKALDLDALASELDEEGFEEGEAPLNVEDLPMRPAFWTILVQPLLPRKKVGRFHLPTETIEGQKHFATIGEVLAIGSLAFKGKTNSGMDLSLEGIKVGDWVAWPRFNGAEFRLKTGHRVVVLDDKDIIAVVTKPQELVTYHGLV